jgi:sulfur-carrier protein
VSTVRVELPVHLRMLAQLDDELRLEVAGAATVENVLDTLESRYPVLRGTIRDHGTHKRRAFIRYFACGQDISHDPPDTPLPEPIASGADVLRVIGAISGG